MLYSITHSCVSNPPYSHVNAWEKTWNGRFPARRRLRGPSFDPSNDMAPGRLAV